MTRAGSQLSFEGFGRPSRNAYGLTLRELRVKLGAAERAHAKATPKTHSSAQVEQLWERLRQARIDLAHAEQREREQFARPGGEAPAEQ